MAEISEIDQVRYDRDVARARVAQLESELRHTKMLLRYAQEAAEAEYQLRVRRADSATPGL